jgi:hypothetical protein
MIYSIKKPINYEEIWMETYKNERKPDLFTLKWSFCWTATCVLLFHALSPLSFQAGSIGTSKFYFFQPNHYYKKILCHFINLKI